MENHEAVFDLRDDEIRESARKSQMLRGVKVLYVEDDADTRLMVTVILESHGAQVTAVETAREALEVLPKLLPHVLLSDIGLPQEDGYTLIQKVRALPPGRGGLTPAAALTAYTSDGDRSRAWGSGFEEHAPKPMDPLSIVVLVANLARESPYGPR
jgi:CheY-like chemotaxis protein